MPPAAAALIVAPFCVAGVLRVDGVDVDGRVCWSELRFCERARTDAIAYGALFGLVSIGECGVEP